MSKECPLIAVIDDDEAVRKALGRLLESADMEVETFAGGREFMEALPKLRPDCAVLDLHMPEVTGFDVLEQLAKSHMGLPVVVITGHDTSDAQARVDRSGAAAYLRKPVNEGLLLAAIAAAITASAARTSPLL